MARMLKATGKVLLVLILLLLSFGVWLVGPGNVSRMFLGMGISHEKASPTLPELPNPAILIFSKTNGFRSDGQIIAANASLEKIAKDRGWSSYTTENAAVFNTEQLARFKAVVWNSTSGDVLTPEQRIAFKGWLEAGGGFVGLHGAGGDATYAWKWYAEELIGTNFIGHTLNPQIQQAKLVIEDEGHPSTRRLGKEWVRSDEWYSFGSSVRAKGYRVLVSLDESTYSPRSKIPFLADNDLSMGKDHPMVWTHCVGKGRVFYSALGHEAKAYAEPKHLEMMGGAISWAAGLEGSQCVGGKEAAASATSR